MELREFRVAYTYGMFNCTKFKTKKPLENLAVVFHVSTQNRALVRNSLEKLTINLQVITKKPPLVFVDWPYNAAP